jgi:NitT/TauT family transport system substrate-binding protein
MHRGDARAAFLGIFSMGACRASRRTMAALLLGASLIGSASAAETSIKFTLDFKIEGPAAPFLLAFDRGYDKAAGVNVAIEPATGSAQAIERVASGFYDMGFADINMLIKVRDAVPTTPVKAAFILYNRPPYAIIGRKSRGVARPKDLEGKTLGAPAADPGFAQWPIFVKANGIDASKVKIENVGLPLREPMLAAGQVDAITGYSFATFIDLKDKGVPVNDITVLLMSDYGVDLYGSAIIVNTKFAAENPDAVRGFVGAFVKGLKDAVRSPASAVDGVLTRNEAAKKNLEIERLQMAIRDNIITPEVEANGYGSIDAVRFEKAIDQLDSAYKWKSAKPKLSDIFDGSFLPAAAKRKVD